jgi:heat shock protein HtpX
VVALVVGAALAALGVVLGVGWWPGVLGLVIGAGLARLHVQRSVDRVVDAVGAVPLGDAPRLENVVDGLCVANGIAHPRLMVVETAARNACVLGLNQRHSTLLVTRGLLDHLSRIQLEGVVARQLALVKSGHAALATVVAAIAPVWSGAPQRLLPARADLLADLDGVGYTRYPPGLIDALQTVAAAPQIAAAPRWTRHLWIDDPVGPADGRAGSLHSTIDERIATLREL